MKTLWRWVILSGAIYATTYIFPGKVTVTPIYVVIIVGAVLMFINTIIKPIISLLTFPINVVTLGVFSVLLNGGIFWGMATIIPGFHIGSFLVAIECSLIVAVLSWLLDHIIPY